MEIPQPPERAGALLRHAGELSSWSDDPDRDQLHAVSDVTLPRIACIGAGVWGVNLVRNFHEIGALHRVCELDAKRRAEVAQKYPSVPFGDSVDQVLQDPAV